MAVKELIRHQELNRRVFPNIKGMEIAFEADVNEEIVFVFVVPKGTSNDQILDGATQSEVLEIGEDFSYRGTKMLELTDFVEKFGIKYAEIELFQ